MRHGNTTWTVNRDGLSGAHAESLSANHLINHGFTVIAKNYACRFGEIDLIAEQGDLTLFIEVKYRSSLSAFSAVECVNHHKMARIKKTAAHYISAYPDPNMFYRFDLIVWHKNNPTPSWIQNI